MRKETQALAAELDFTVKYKPNVNVTENTLEIILSKRERYGNDNLYCCADTYYQWYRR